MFLIVEDNELLAKNIKMILEMNQYKADIAYNATQAKEKLAKNKYNLIILDINLPDKNWFELLKELRKNNNTPVLILTSKNLIEDKVKWLELWADDYLTKPFDITELLARIKAILRRYSWVSNNVIKIKDLEIYPDQEKVIKNWHSIWLSSLEFKLLMYFIQNRWKILNRQEIYENVWWDFDTHMFSRTVDVYIWYLRKKLWKDLIKTKKWSGYFLED